MIIVYQKISADEIRKGAAKAIVDIGEWFKNNPKRRMCNVSLWYGKSVKVKRKTIAEQINAAAAEALR